MKIPVAGLSEGVHEYRFDENASAIELGPEFSPVHVDVRLEKTDDGLHLSAKVRTRMQATCDRCLQEYTQPLAPSYEMHYLYDQEEAGRLDPAEVQFIAPATPSIDIAEDVRQTVLVSVPLKLLCKEDCKGLCPQCGKNFNEGLCDCQPKPSDPRWDALRNLRSKE